MTTIENVQVAAKWEPKLPQLRVKIRSLRLEENLIREYEQRELRRKRRCEAIAASYAQEADKPKYLGYALIHGETQRELREHRRQLAWERRHAVLVCAFLRGRPYRKCENPKPENKPNELLLAQMVARFVVAPGEARYLSASHQAQLRARQEAAQAIVAWLEAK